MVEAHQWKEDDRKHHDIIANDTYDKTIGPAWDRAYEVVTINDWVSVMKGQTIRTVLELGCGTGESVTALAKVGFRVTAFDHSIGMIKKTRNKIKLKEYGNVSYVIGDAESLPFKSESFDAVTVRWVLHHLPHFQQAASEVCRVCRKGGWVFIAEVSNRFGIGRLTNICLWTAFGVFNKATKNRYNKLAHLESIVPTHERSIDPTIVLKTLETSVMSTIQFFTIPHLGILYHYLPSTMTRELVLALARIGKFLRIKNSPVFVIHARKNRY